MVTIQLDIDTKNERLLRNIDKETLSFLLSRVFEEYKEELQDQKLRKQILQSKELDDVLNSIKI